MSILRHHEGLTQLRRDLHANPELGFEEHRTGALVAEKLRSFGVDEVHTGIARTGVVGLIRGRGNGGRAIGLRADMDALPILEENEFAHRSTRSGLMHGCGHDGHTTILLGAAQYLAATRRFDGNAVLIFQPGEEGYAGAKAMIDDGLFERFPVDEVYALHNWPALDPGHIGLNPGPMMAAADRIEITICGKGGHAAHPHRAVDPVVVAAHIVTAAQTIISRNVAPLDSAVLSLCSIHAGNPGAFSVIPREAKIVGTVRTFSADEQNLIEQRLTELAEGDRPRIRRRGEACSTSASTLRRSTTPFRRALRPIPRRSLSARTTSCATSNRRWVRKTSVSCCAKDPAAMCASGRAAARMAASCTTPDMISMTP